MVDRVVPLRIPVEDRMMSVGDLASKVKSGLENYLQLEGPDPFGGQHHLVEMKGSLRWCDTHCDYGRELDYYLPAQRQLVLTVDAIVNLWVPSRALSLQVYGRTRPLGGRSRASLWGERRASSRAKWPPDLIRALRGPLKAS